MLLQARQEQVGTPLKLVFAAPGEEVAHGQGECGGFTALRQRIGPAPNGVHIVFVAKATMVWCDLAKINQGQVRTIHHNVVTVKIVVSVTQTMEGVHSSHQLSKSVLLLLDIVQHSRGCVLNSCGSSCLHDVVS